jgi:hypothetical protein
VLSAIDEAVHIYCETTHAKGASTVKTETGLPKKLQRGKLMKKACTNSQ